MKLNVKALAITFAILWGGCVLLVAVCHRFYPGYGSSFLNGIASIYPGYHPAGLRSAALATLYAVFDGAVGGAVIAWIYNKVNGSSAAA